MTNSRAKGARGERELRDFLRAHGIEARRGQQYSGSPDSPDVVTELDGFVHFECKRTERFNAYEALGQAERDAGGKMPVVFHRKNGKQWIAVLRGEDAVELLKLRDAERRAA